jgi:hypothetical protein
MNFDRSLLALLVLTMVARLTHAPAHVCETLCIFSGLQVWRLHPKALRVGAPASVSLS